MRQQGFNILELMIAVAIAGIIALIGIPAMTTTVENARTRSVTGDITDAVGLARSEAVRTGTDMTVQSRADSDDNQSFDNGWCVVADGDGCDDDSVLRLFEPPDNVDLSVENVTAELVFDSQGASTSNSTPRFTVKPPDCSSGTNRARRIEIRSSGRAEVTRRDC